MPCNKKKIIFFLFILLSLVAMLWMLFYGASYSYQNAACFYNQESTNCLLESKEWQEGRSVFYNELQTNKDTLNALIKVLYETWNIDFDSSNALSSLYPLEVLKTQKAGCMGFAWLSLMLAEEFGFSLEVVMLPAHVFLRYNGINLEPNRKAHTYSDREYQEKYKEGPWTGLEWKALSKKEFLGLVAFNIGNHFMYSDSKQALVWYKMAKSLFPAYPGISINRNWILQNTPKE